MLHKNFNGKASKKSVTPGSTLWHVERAVVLERLCPEAPICNNCPACMPRKVWPLQPPKTFNDFLYAFEMCSVSIYMFPSAQYRFLFSYVFLLKQSSLLKYLRHLQTTVFYGTTLCRSFYCTVV